MNVLTTKIYYFFALIAVIFLSYQGAIYFHEWVHGTAAWLTGYKAHPFDIHYGEKWFTLWDIDEAVPYKQIIADKKLFTMALIAISPLVCQSFLFVLGLKCLNLNSIQRNWILLAFVYWFTFFQLAEIYAYIPLRTFAAKDDVYNFLYATHLSPWFIAIPGTAFVLWGIYRMLKIEEPKVCSHLNITSWLGRFLFLFATVFLFFGYYGSLGFLMNDPISQMLTKISWCCAPIIFLLLIYRLSRK